MKTIMRKAMMRNAMLRKGMLGKVCCGYLRKGMLWKSMLRKGMLRVCMLERHMLRITNISAITGLSLLSEYAVIGDAIIFNIFGRNDIKIIYVLEYICLYLLGLDNFFFRYNNIKMLVFDMAEFTTINEHGIVYKTLYDTFFTLI